MNQLNPNQQNPDIAEVYFTDGIVLGPGIAMKSVGAELPALILAMFEQCKVQELFPPTLGVASAVLTFLAVGTGNHVSINAPPGQVNYGAQLAYLFQRDNAVGGVGVVVVDLASATVTTYGGRGFPEVQPSNLYMASTFSIDQLELAIAEGFGAAPAPKKAKARRKGSKKKEGEKKAPAKKKAAAKAKAKPAAPTAEVRL